MLILANPIRLWKLKKQWQRSILHIIQAHRVFHNLMVERNVMEEPSWKEPVPSWHKPEYLTGCGRGQLDTFA